MYNSRPLPIGHSNHQVLNNLSSNIRSQKLVAGKGIAIAIGNDGTHISCSEPNRKDKMSWAEPYDSGAEYYPNDVVFVDPTLTYLDTDGNPLPYTSSSEMPLCGGSWLCVRYVPPANANSSSFLTQVVPAYGGSVINDMAQLYRWDDYNVYYPSYPTIPTSSATVALDEASGYDIQANQVYWQPLSPMMPIQVCINNITTTMYINGIVSGSMYNLATLPWTP